MIRFLTAGESHGKSLTTIIEGFPSNIPISREEINRQLKRRQSGYGRGGRMLIESDEIEILSGIRFGKTIGSPISFLVRNYDWKNWELRMSSEPIDDDVDKITIPRPGHADLTGSIKYNYSDIRNSIERSSARETAARVAACSVAREFLKQFNIKIGSFVESIGGIFPVENYLSTLINTREGLKVNPDEMCEISDKSPVRVLNCKQEELIIERIKEAKKNGDTLGGTFVVVATGLPEGLGSFVHYDRRLDAEIAEIMMSVPAVKGVEIGAGFSAANVSGSNIHDEIIIENNAFSRSSNRAGGIEGGISTGMPIIVRVAMKPIATLMMPLNSIDLKTMEKVESRRERSDFVAVPACAVIGEAMLAWTIASFLLEKFGGDSLEEVKRNYESYKAGSFERVRINFS